MPFPKNLPAKATIRAVIESFTDQFGEYVSCPKCPAVIEGSGICWAFPSKKVFNVLVKEKKKIDKKTSFRCQRCYQLPQQESTVVCLDEEGTYQPTDLVRRILLSRNQTENIVIEREDF